MITTQSLMLRRFSSMLLFVFAFLQTSLAFAELDLTILKGEDEDTYVRLDFQAVTAQFIQDNPWGGESEVFLGGDTSYWSEYGFEPGVEGKFRFGDAGMSLTGRVSGVWTKTRRLDSAGSNFGDTSNSDITLEDAYLKWTSGSLFSGLGQDALEISLGSQAYQVGNGFLIFDGASDGGERGGFWLGLRSAFDMAGIVRLTTGNWMVEAVYLDPDDVPDSNTKVGGTNIEYTLGDAGVVGGGYWNIYESDNDARDGLSVFDIRADLTPFENRAVSLAGEFVKEKNGKLNDSWAAYGQVGYDFGLGEDVTLKPAVSYRYANFSGDNLDSDTDNSFDPLFYGFNDWNEWYIGEITGEYIAGNSNFNAQTVKVAVKPTNSITAYFFYHYFRLNEFTDNLIPRPPLPPVGSGAIENKSFGHEVNLIMDWAVTDHFNVSATANILVPAEGGRDFFGSSDNWMLAMLWAQVKF